MANIQNFVIQSVIPTIGSVVFVCKQGEFRINGVLDRGSLDSRETTINYKPAKNGGFTVKNVIQTEDRIVITTNHPDPLIVHKMKNTVLAIELKKSTPSVHTEMSSFYKEVPLTDLIDKRLDHAFSSSGGHIGECWLIAANPQSGTQFNYYLVSDTHELMICNYMPSYAGPVTNRPVVTSVTQSKDSVSFKLSEGPDCVYLYNSNKKIKLLKEIVLVEKT